ncbi:MAG TPA: carboxypeptidase-like regulatory domain-containing protein [Candidatus Acidoferrum sp.]
MKILKSISIAFVLLTAFFSAAPAWAQTASTAIVLGTVTDPAGAVIPDTKVDLTNVATNETRSMQTNASGQYVFPNVAPGTYTLKFFKQGFATTTVSAFKADVSRSNTFDLKLEIRPSNEIVEVSAESRAELQTTDAVVGNVIGGALLARLPTLNRDAGELMTLQPGSTPYDPTGGDAGGTVAGARSDQNAFNLDGIDVTDNVIAGGGLQTPIIPIGVDEVEEFRVGLTNNNATFGRASGGQVNLINKTAGNQYHGTVYWYHLNSALSANAWDLNHTPDANTGKPFTAKPKEHENRGGINFGGPIRKNKTFVSGNYEIHRFPSVIQIERIVPTDTLRNGTLIFNGTPYNLATSTACGSGGTQACDPRGIGISPTIQQLWRLLPEGNDPNVGDKVNTLGFRTTVPSAEREDSVKFKLDHEFTEKIHFLGRYFYHRDLRPNGNQADLRGNQATNPSDSNVRGDGFIAGLDWQLRPNLTNTFRSGWIRSRQDFTVIRPSASSAQLALPGTASSLSPSGFIALAPGLAQGADVFLDAPVDVDTQRARHQAIYDSNKQYVDTLTWIKGKHTVVGGADIRWLPTIHDRDDKVVGSLNSLVALEDADVSNFLTIPAANRPPGLSSSDAQRWDRFYAAALGLIDNVGILAIRDGNLQPKPLGATLIARTTLRSYNFYTQDTWRMTPSFTLTYGLSYGWQTTPHELNQQQTFIVNHDNGDQIISGQDYINQKAAAAANGDFFNPTLAYLPIKDSGRSDVFKVDYGDWAPRLSAAWNPSFRQGFMSHVFGDRKTVIRGGYGIAYDRVNTVQSVIIPMLGVGFAQTINAVKPLCDATGAGGANCSVPMSVTDPNVNPGLYSFRVGVDGAIPTPPPPTALTSPVIPAGGFSELLSFQNDPNFKVGRSHMIDLTVQRSLPAQMILELGYIGRLGRNLPNSFNFNSSPYMFKDKTSGQTFAQAFDAVAGVLRAGGTPTDQPWFENLFPNLCPLLGVPAASSTSCISTLNSSGFSNGNVTSLFLLIDGFRGAIGLPTFNNQQVLELFMRTTGDISNYHAGFVALRNNNWRGLYFDLNYTYSKSLDQVGAVQNDARYYSSSFNRHLDYGPSFFDRPHVFNGTFSYDLPFGKGHLGGAYAPMRKVLGGWYIAGIIRAESGIPELVSESNQSFGGGLIFGTSNGAIPSVPISSLGGGSPHSVPCSSGAGSNGNTCNGGTGTGLNYFGDPATAITKFRRTLLSSDTNSGRDSPLRGLPYKDFDARVGKSTSITERAKVEFSFDFFNAFNHVNFVDPSFDLTNPAQFGVINTQYIPANRLSGSRWIEFGLRLSF